MAQFKITSKLEGLSPSEAADYSRRYPYDDKGPRIDGDGFDPETFDLLKRRATTVWLRAKPEDHWSRVVAQGDTRPMANNAQAFRDLGAILEQRERLYRQAQVTVETSGRGVAAVGAELAARFRGD